MQDRILMEAWRVPTSCALALCWRCHGDKAGIDPVTFWLNLVGDEQFVQVREDFRFDASRLGHAITLR